MSRTRPLVLAMMSDLDTDILNQIGDVERERMVVVESANNCGENSFPGVRLSHDKIDALGERFAGVVEELMKRSREIKRVMKSELT